jgi:hypothetical protein
MAFMTQHLQTLRAAEQTLYKVGNVILARQAASRNLVVNSHLLALKEHITLSTHVTPFAALVVTFVGHLGFVQSFVDGRPTARKFA